MGDRSNRNFFSQSDGSSGTPTNGYLFNNGLMNFAVNVANQATFDPSGANITWVTAFVLSSPVNLNRVSFKQGTVVVAGTHCSFGIYTAGGALICQGTFDSGVLASTNKTATFTLVTLLPGIYYLAWTCDDATVNSAYSWGLANTTVLDLMNQTTIKKVGTANTSVGGVLPATMGAVTSSGLTGLALPACIFDFN